MVKKLKLAPYTLKRYEPNLDSYFFYNVSTSDFWQTDSITGFVISSLDGSLSRDEVVNVLFSNNPEISKAELEKHFYNVFDFLIGKGYICEEY